MNIAESTAKEKGLHRKHRISDGWLRRFIEKQPQLSLHKGDSTVFVCMDAMKKQTSYYITLKNFLIEGDKTWANLLSGMALDHRSPYVATRKGQRKVRYCASGNKSQITIVACINAIGQTMPLFIIFDAKNLEHGMD